MHDAISQVPIIGIFWFRWHYNANQGTVFFGFRQHHRTAIGYGIGLHNMTIKLTIIAIIGFALAYVGDPSGTRFWSGLVIAGLALGLQPHRDCPVQKAGYLSVRL